MQGKTPFEELDATPGRLTLQAVSEALRTRGDPAAVSHEVKADVAALGLRPYPDSSSWGTRYGPLTTFKLADGTIRPGSLEVVDPTFLGVWEKRARDAKHAALRFRYADLVWDLTN